jgi:hypothetical protein
MRPLRADFANTTLSIILRQQFVERIASPLLRIHDELSRLNRKFDERIWYELESIKHGPGESGFRSLRAILRS